MNLIHLLPIAEPGRELLEFLRATIPAQLHARCEILDAPFDPAPAFHPGRQQYGSTQILALMQPLAGAENQRLLAVTPLDLYIPILTFVFGEAQVSGACAVLSTHRLRQEFYGLPSDLDLTQQRALKEAVHELGHTLGLMHCGDYRCAMAPSHAVEWIDLKGSSLCPNCRAAAHEPNSLVPLCRGGEK